MAQSGDDVYLTYTEFVHGDRSLAAGQSTSTSPSPISRSLPRPAGGDQVLLMHYSASQRTWTGPFRRDRDAARTSCAAAVAVDGQGRAWIFYSAQRTGNFDLYARKRTPTAPVSRRSV